jgi:hypothetical protein
MLPALTLRALTAIVRRLLGTGADEFDFGHFAVFTIHLIEDDRMPRHLTLMAWNIVFTRPPAQTQFLDKVHLRRNTA